MWLSPKALTNHYSVKFVPALSTNHEVTVLKKHYDKLRGEGERGKAGW